MSENTLNILELLAEGLIVLSLAVIVLYIYFLPSIIARKRKKTNLTAIFVLNLFFGWSLIGWVAAMIWAVLKEQTQSSDRPPP